MTPQIIVSVAAVILSLLFTYVPGLNAKYAAMEKSWKQLSMLGLMVLVTGFVVLSSCMEWWIWMSCDKQGVLEALGMLALAVAVNQGTHSITPEPPKVRAAKSNG